MVPEIPWYALCNITFPDQDDQEPGQHATLHFRGTIIVLESPPSRI
jgi:hypothetical protein